MNQRTFLVKITYRFVDGTCAEFVGEERYRSHNSYLEAVARAMRACEIRGESFDYGSVVSVS